MKTIRILLADDHVLIREGLSRLIGAEADMEVVSEASNGFEVLELVRGHRPDVIVMDLSMPGMDGLEATKRLKPVESGIKVVVLTVEDEEVYLRKLIQAGASGYVLKRSASEVLIEAIRTVATGGCYYDAKLTGKALAAQIGAANPPNQTSRQMLSRREKEVLILLAWGHSSKEIAARLDLSPKTVETYKVRIGDKLGLRSRTEFVRYALHQKWLNDTVRS